MKNLSDGNTYNEIIERIEKLHPDSKAKWGKMNVAQMMAHLQEPLKAALATEPTSRMLLGRLLGWAFKKKLYDDNPWRKNLPTSPSFIFNDERNFDKEKTALLNKVKAFYEAGDNGIGNFSHPMFGKFTKDQWGMSAYKHIAHHLEQFGV